MTATLEAPTVLLEHPDFLLVNKPALWLVHGAHRHATDVLTVLRQARNEPGLAPAHRLDRETSGALILTRNADAARAFHQLFARRRMIKSYLAIVQGEPAWPEQTVDAPLDFIGVSETNPVIVRQGLMPEGKPAVTHFRVIERRGGYSLLEATPQTGRMHQIRAHLEHAGFPLVGDKIYGGDPQAFLDFIEHGLTPALLKRVQLPRQALHAATLSFEWAGEGMRLDVPLAADLAEFWASLSSPLPLRVTGTAP